MFYFTDSIKKTTFTARDHDGVILPEMVIEDPEHESYIELVEVIISPTGITPMKNGWYHLAPNFYENGEIDVLDTQGLMSSPDNTKFFHIICAVEHVYDPKTTNTLHFPPIVVHAEALTGISEEASEFSGMIYVPNGKSELVLDSEFKDYDREYLNAHPDINKDAIIYVKYRIASFNTLSLENTAPCFKSVAFDDTSYYETTITDRSPNFLFLDGIEDILKNHMLSFTLIKEYSCYDETGWFSGESNLYTNMELVC